MAIDDLSMAIYDLRMTIFAPEWQSPLDTSIFVVSCEIGTS